MTISTKILITLSNVSKFNYYIIFATLSLVWIAHYKYSYFTTWDNIFVPMYYILYLINLNFYINFNIFYINFYYVIFKHKI